MKLPEYGIKFTPEEIKAGVSTYFENELRQTSNQKIQVSGACSDWTKVDEIEVGASC